MVTPGAEMSTGKRPAAAAPKLVMVRPEASFAVTVHSPATGRVLICGLAMTTSKWSKALVSEKESSDPSLTPGSLTATTRTR